jgi:hypothetical protein
MPAFGDACAARLVRLLHGGALASAGIVNGHNACYMNAALQLLYAMSTVRAAVERRAVSPLTRALREIFAELGGAAPARGLVQSGRYDAINGAMGAARTRAGTMGCADEVLVHLLVALERGCGGSYSVTETTYGACDGTERVVGGGAVPYIPMLAPGTRPTTVQELVDALAVPERVDYEGCARYTKRTDLSVDHRNVYAVAFIRRLQKGEVSATAVGCATLRLARAEYTLTGAVLYDAASTHYVFVRTTVEGDAVHVTRVYDDADVRERTALRVERTATALLFRRT